MVWNIIIKLTIWITLFRLVDINIYSCFSLVDALALATSSPSFPSSDPNVNRKVLRVCQSPGCKDDGAASTFDYLSALAPPGVAVVRGKCVSQCGAGPVVEVVCGHGADASSIKSTIHNRIKSTNEILSLLDVRSSVGSALKPYLWDRLLDGYELSLKANEAYKSKKYQLAVELYTEAIESGRKPAMMLQEARMKSQNSPTVNSEDRALNWLVTSFKNSCRSRLALKDIDGGRRDAFAATVFSKSLDADAYECLAEVCAASADKLGELQSLKAAIQRYDRLEEENDSKMNAGVDAPMRADAARVRNHAAARKRELGFRVAQLNRLM